MTARELLDLLRRSGLAAPEDLDRFERRADGLTAGELAAALVREGELTPFQARQLLRGRWRGFVIAGRFRVLQPLGVGGLAAVCLAEDVKGPRLVALKVLRPERTPKGAEADELRGRAERASALRHPNLVRLEEVGEDRGVHYRVMEYVDGTDLHSLVSRSGPLSPGRAACYAAEAAAGLQHMHEAGLVHGDVKPANVALGRRGEVKVLDLCMASPSGEAHAEEATADYLAPEQAAARPADARADVYSLGASLYFLLTGEPPFGGTLFQKLLGHQVREPRPVTDFRADVPAGLLDALRRMMAKEPARRYQSAEEAGAALRSWAPPDPPAPSPQELPGPCPAVAKRLRQAGSEVAEGTVIR